MVAISRLPDLCLLALFEQMTPADQIVARSVNSRWSELVPEAANHRHTLALIVGHCTLPQGEEHLFYLHYGTNWQYLKHLKKADGSGPMYPIRRLSKWNTLLFESLDEDIISEIIATFWSVKTLQIVIIDTSYILVTEHQVRLLLHWSTTLTSLTLINQIGTCPLFSDGHLTDAINHLSALEHLSLKVTNYEPWDKLTILHQLEQLDLIAPVGVLIALMVKNQSERLPARITFHQIHFDQVVPSYQLITLPEDIRLRFTFIQPNARSKSLTDYGGFFWSFRALTTLRIELDYDTWRGFLRVARQLSALIQLHLNIKFHHIYSTFFFNQLALQAKILGIDRGVEAGLLGENRDEDEDDEPLMPQLKSVKLLILEPTSIYSHEDLEKLKLEWSVPNVQVLILQLGSGGAFRCTTCFTGDHIDEEEIVMTNKACLRVVLNKLKQKCTNLKYIGHSQEDLLGSAEEILAASE